MKIQYYLIVIASLSFKPSIAQNHISNAEKIRFLFEAILKKVPTGSIFINTPNRKFLDLEQIDSVLAENSQSLVFNKRTLFLNINGTGRIYRIDTSGKINRLDNTYYQGETFGAKFLSYKDTLILAGGYGFWNCSGAIRFFKDNFNEWDIHKIENPLPFSNGVNAYCFWSKKTDKIYVIYTDANPEYKISNHYERHVKVQAFDFKQKKWWENEKILNPEIAEDLSDLKFVIETDKGPVINIKNNRESVLINFETEKLYNVSEKVSDNIIQQLNKARNSLIYSSKDSIQILDLTKKISFSIPFNSSLLKQNKLSLFVKSIQLTDYLTPYNLTIAILALALLIVIRWKKKTKPTHSETKKEANQSLSSPLENFQKFLLSLEEDEKLILELLATNEAFKKNTSTIELNKKMGIEKRPLKIQNNMRATSIGLINRKFNLLSTVNEELIIRIRSEFDKRFFEYRLNSRFAHMVMKYFGI